MTMPVSDDTIKATKADLEAELTQLRNENNNLNKQREETRREVQNLNARYNKLFGLFANNIDYYLGNK